MSDTVENEQGPGSGDTRTVEEREEAAEARADLVAGQDDAVPGRSGEDVRRRGTEWVLLLVALGIGLLVATLSSGFDKPSTFVTQAVIVAAVVFILGNWLVSRVVEGPRKGMDKLVTSLVYTAFILAIIPLVSIIYTVVRFGYRRFDVAFFTETLRGVIGEGGGAAHAIIGTLIVTGITALISVPIGLMTAIYLVEYGKGPLARAITFLVDIMTGIPSIVAGLFAVALFTLITSDPGYKSGLGGAIALSLLMIPIVVRSCEEMLRLVPDRLRQSALALGVPKWLTIIKVVIPTAIAGIAAGVTISVARVIGETAPLLLIAGLTTRTNTDATEGLMPTLPVYVYYQYTQPGVPPAPAQDRAWAGALTLILIVMLLNLGARAIARIFAPKTR